MAPRVAVGRAGFADSVVAVAAAPTVGPFSAFASGLAVVDPEP